MDDATRYAVLQLLGEAMSGVSEECWYSGWVGGAEFTIPELCRRAVESGNPQPWGGGVITPVQARGFLFLAGQLGCWANWDTATCGYVAHQPFPLPP